MSDIHDFIQTEQGALDAQEQHNEVKAAALKEEAFKYRKGTIWLHKPTGQKVTIMASSRFGMIDVIVNRTGTKRTVAKEALKSISKF